MICTAEYTNVGERRVSDTISTLRQMRFAGEMAQSQPEVTSGTQKVLMDAEILAKSAAPYLIHFLINAHTPEMLKQWDEVIAEMKAKYHHFPEIRRFHLDSSTKDVKTKLMIMSMKDLNDLTYCFITSNNLGEIEFTDLFDDSLGILAPLSTDILAASLLPEFIYLHYSHKLPQVKPVLLSTDLRSCIFPTNEFGEPVFATMNRVLGFIDLDATGSTRHALVKAAELEYPSKVIPTGSSSRHWR